MQRLKFKDGKLEDFTIVLCTRDYRKLGQLTGLKGVHYACHDNSPNEISFSLTKHDLLAINGNTNDDIALYLKIKNALWEQIEDFKVIWLKDTNEYFEIKVSTNDSFETSKTITGTPIPEAELSQMLLSIEINTEDDIVANGTTSFYNENDTSVSLLHRVLARATGYTIKYVDDSLKNLQRVFSVSDSTIYDFLVGECSEQFNCIFKFDSSDRTIWVYDLYTVCLDCGERIDQQTSYEQEYKCPKCDSTNLKHYGEDTTIYVDKNNLTDSITLEVNADNVKNCFKLVAGDEYMTATIRMLNPNGSDYIYHIPEYLKRDMPKELVDKLDSYDQLYNSYLEESEQLASDIYKLYDDIAYLTSGMMPKIEHVNDIPSTETISDPKQGILYVYEETVYLYDDNGAFVPQEGNSEFFTNLVSSFVSAEKEAEKLNTVNLGTLGVFPFTPSTSDATVNTAMKNFAKVFVKTGYVKVEVDTENADYKPEFSFETFTNKEGKKEVQIDENGYHFGTWRGRFKITNYSNEEDVAYSEYLTVHVHDNYKDFVEQRVLKNMTQYDEDGSIFDVLSIGELEDFKSAIKLYGKNRLESFYDAIQLAQDVLYQLDQATEYADLYDVLYVPYTDKLNAIGTVCNTCGQGIESIDIVNQCPHCGSMELTHGELVVRREQINELQMELEKKDKRRTEIIDILNLEKYLGEYYPIFASYRRESVYSNDNYFSDGLSNAEMIIRAKEFIDTATQELYKSSEQQITISATLYNLLLIPEFASLVDKFDTGNTIRIRIDGILYKLRLLNYAIDFDNSQTLNVEFSNVSKSYDLTNEIQYILESAKSMGQTYGYVAKQADKGSVAQDNIQSWIQNGLNTGLIQIQSGLHSEIINDGHGLLCRAFDDISGTYDARQLKITNNCIVFTDTNWKSVRQVIGEHNYFAYNDETNLWEQKSAYGLTSDFVQSGQVSGAIIVGGMIYSDNYSNGTNGKEPAGTYIDLNTGEFSFGGGSLYYKDGEFVLSDTVIGKSLEAIDIKAENLHIDAANIEGLLQANQINVENLHVNAANIDGRLTAEQIEADELHVKSASIADEVEAENVTGTRFSGKEFVSSQRTKLDEDVLGLYIGEDGFDYCWNAASDFSETEYEGEIIYGHFTITKQFFYISVDSKILLSFSPDGRIGGGNLGSPYVRIPTLVYDNIYQNEEQ